MLIQAMSVKKDIFGCSDAYRFLLVVSSEMTKEYNASKWLTFHQALWLSGYSDRLEIYFLRERRFESCRRRLLLHYDNGVYLLFAWPRVLEGRVESLGQNGGWTVKFR